MSGVHIPCPTSPPAAPNTHLAPYAARGLKGRILSGVQPTGNLHLGNYLGAIRNFARLQDDYECLYCVVDLHAITQPQDPKLLAAQTREIAAAYLAAGVDRQEAIIFNQSMVPAHAELAWIFNCVARVGWLNRMTQFKEKAGKDRENASLGLYTYPALKAADILIYKATHVPVGEDQKQHLELTRDIAIKFNNDFNAPDFFPLTEPLIFGAGDAGHEPARRHQEDEQVRSVGLFAHQPDRRRRRHRPEDPPRQDRSAAHAGDAGRRGEAARGGQPARHLRRAGRPREGRGVREFAGKQFSEFKPALTELAVAKLGPIGAEMQRLMKDPGHVDAVLHDGAQRARPSPRRSWRRSTGQWDS